MKKPMIAIVPLYDEQKESYWMLPGYMKGIEMAGGLPVMLPLIHDKQTLQQIVETFDGFLFTGGHDISPVLYHEEPLKECGLPCIERDKMEVELLKMVIDNDKSALGICRGIQLFNVVFGGTLYQDLPSQRPTYVGHHQTPPYNQPVHRVKLLKDTPIYHLLKKEEISVNSYHHQAIKDLSSSFEIMAYSEDYLVEGIYHPYKKFIWAIQWHPEFLYLIDDHSQKIFKAFIESCYQ